MYVCVCTNQNEETVNAEEEGREHNRSCRNLKPCLTFLISVELAHILLLHLNFCFDKAQYLSTLLATNAYTYLYIYTKMLQPLHELRIKMEIWPSVAKLRRSDRVQNCGRVRGYNKNVHLIKCCRRFEYKFGQNTSQSFTNISTFTSHNCLHVHILI